MQKAMRGPDHPNPIERLRTETEDAFNWLAAGLDCQLSVTFVPNPGNIGDAIINLACWKFLDATFKKVEICSSAERPGAEYVFVGGGGNFVEPLYKNIASLVGRLEPHQRIFIFPSTIYGYSEILGRIGPRARIVCRDAISFRFVQDHMAADDVRLGHDAAFAVGPQLVNEYADRIARRSSLEARLYRTDRERALSDAGGLDIMGQLYSDWLDMTVAESAMRLAVKYILGFGRIHTDRLHCAILSAILGRETILYPNSYFKNGAVFDHSLSRIPNVRFDRERAVQSDPALDPVAFHKNSERPAQ